MHKYFLLFITVLFVSCDPAKKMKITFEESPTPPVPSYDDENNWAALPWKKDYADSLPIPTLVDRQAEASVDVFYIHPTTFKNSQAWNADVNDSLLNQKTESRPIMHQASIFNGSCRVFAPRYRQATFYSFFAMDENAAKALRLAYSDVKNAFEHYMENYNEGRPIVLATHSQGSFHGKKLMAEYFDSSYLQEKLVVAYLVGMPVFEKDYESIFPCKTPEENGCYVSWATFKKGHYPKFYEQYLKGAVCVNPLNWTADKKYYGGEHHKGLVGLKFDEIVMCEMGASVQDDILWVDQPDVPGIPSKLVKNWHIGDFNLFYLNVRENVKRRVEAYLNE